MARHRQRSRMPSGFRSVRDVLTAGLGAAGIVHETLLSQQERPTLLIIYAGLLGLPLVFREQDKRPSDGKGSGGHGDEKGSGGL